MARCYYCTQLGRKCEYHSAIVCAWESCWHCQKYGSCPCHPSGVIASYHRELIKIAERQRKPYAMDVSALIAEIQQTWGSPTGRIRRVAPPLQGFDYHPDPISYNYHSDPVEYYYKSLNPEHPRQVIVGVDPGYPIGGAVTFSIDDVGNYHIQHEWGKTRKHPADLNLEKYYESYMRSYAKADIEATYNMYTVDFLKIDPPLRGEPQMDRLQVVEAEIKRLQKERAILARFPKDNFAEGTVIKFERVFGVSWEDRGDFQVYVYAAIKIGKVWYLTASPCRPQQCMSWAQLTEWLGEGVGEMVIMEEKVSLLAVPEEFTGAKVTLEPAAETTVDAKDAEADADASFLQDEEGPLGANDEKWQ